MSISVLIVDDEPDVEAYFASNSGATCAPTVSKWILRHPPRRRWRVLRVLLSSHQF